MDPKPDVKILSHGEVQKKIIQEDPKPRPVEDYLGPFNNYNDENYQIYLKKRQQFLDAAKKYRKLTEETLTCNKRRLHEDYMDNLDLDFLTEESESPMRCEPSKNGKLVKKRTTRPINTLPEEAQTSCNLDALFKRYLVLNKLIWAARTVVLKNRMLKNLEKLKKLDAESVKQFETPINVYEGCYPELFAKFV